MAEWRAFKVEYSLPAGKEQWERAAIVENRNVSIKDKVIHEGTNTNKTRNNAIRENKENTQKFSNQVNQEKTSYREALIRSNYS
jgi:hypothetical protein